MSDGAVKTAWLDYRREWRRAEAEIIEEKLVTLYVNGQEFVNIMCTPLNLEELALGFLSLEGIIHNLEDIDHMTISADQCCLDVWLRHSTPPPHRRIITTGCGGGITFDDPTLQEHALPDGIEIEPEALFEWLNQLHQPGGLHARARGVHAAGITDQGQVRFVREDVGRHNTIDKLQGACLQADMPTEGKTLLVTGRVSSEMIGKAIRMGCPIIASRNSPTSLSVAMAEKFNVTLAGYVRRDSMRVYAHPERLGYSAPFQQKLEL
ncbi:MAG: formate dehydrogenase accessory sulfurtransferase FdhD [Anaerolineales bacterium]|jgi:FdhD protein